MDQVHIDMNGSEIIYLGCSTVEERKMASKFIPVLDYKIEKKLLVRSKYN